MPHMEAITLVKSIILKFSTSCILAVNHFFLFQLKAHNIFNTYFFHLLPPTCISACYTIFRETRCVTCSKTKCFRKVALKCTTYLYTFYFMLFGFRKIAIKCTMYLYIFYFLLFPFAVTSSPSFLLAQAIFQPNLFPYEYSNIPKPSHSSYLSAYEDGTDRVFRNVGI
jgi:hypothetical protein